MTALAIRPEQEQWTAQQAAVLKSAGIRPKDAVHAQLFLTYCQRTGLDPFSRQIYLIEGQPAASIDGLRLVAQRSGEYRGQSPAQWCGPDGVWHDVWLGDGPPSAARVSVYREGFDQPVTAVATWREFGRSGGSWQRMGPHMLAKVAEAHALRKAFPNDLSGIYSSDELGDTTAAAGPVRVDTSHLVDKATGEIHEEVAPPVTGGQTGTDPTVDHGPDGEPVDAEVVDDNGDGQEVLR